MVLFKDYSTTADTKPETVTARKALDIATCVYCVLGQSAAQSFAACFVE